MGIRYHGTVTVEVKDRGSVRPDGAGLLPRQRRLLVAVAELRVELEACPTYQQVSDRVGLRSSSDVAQVIERVLSMGYLKRDEYSAKRTLQPTDLGWKISGVDSMGLADPRVQRPHRCPRCAAATFKPHSLQTCRQLLTGQKFEEQTTL